jgi:hypothetical protein
MSSGIVFILHGPAEAAYAAELAETLSPHLAFPVALSPDVQRPTQYGAGAVCAVLWTQDAATRALAGEVARAMHGAVSNAIVCRFGRAPLPAELAANACVQAQPQVSAQDLAGPLRNAIERRLQDWEERSTGPRRSARPTLGAAVAQAPASSGGRRMVVRSAWGLAATMAVVGVAAPVVSDRAGAANITPDQASAPNEATVASVGTVNVAAQPEIDTGGQVAEAAIAAVSYPAPDPLVALIQQPEPEPAIVAVAHEAPVRDETAEALIATAAFDTPELDPKTSQAIAAMVASADVSDWKIEAVASPPARHAKPDAAPPAPAKPSL